MKFFCNKLAAVFLAMRVKARSGPLRTRRGLLCCIAPLVSLGSRVPPVAETVAAHFKYFSISRCFSSQGKERYWKETVTSYIMAFLYIVT